MDHVIARLGKYPIIYGIVINYIVIDGREQNLSWLQADEINIRLDLVKQKIQNKVNCQVQKHVFALPIITTASGPRCCSESTVFCPRSYQFWTLLSRQGTLRQTTETIQVKRLSQDNLSSPAK